MKNRYGVYARETQYKDGQVANESWVHYGYTWAVSPAKAISQICFRFGRRKEFYQTLGAGSYYKNTLIAIEE